MNAIEKFPIIVPMTLKSIEYSFISFKFSLVKLSSAIF